MRAGASHQSDQSLPFFLVCVRSRARLIAGICSAMVSIWLAAATGHGSRGIRCDSFPKIRLHPRGSLDRRGVRMISTYSECGRRPRQSRCGSADPASRSATAPDSVATIVPRKIEISSDVLVGGGVGFSTALPCSVGGDSPNRSRHCPSPSKTTPSSARTRPFSRRDHRPGRRGGRGVRRHRQRAIRVGRESGETISATIMAQAASL